jgi:hypothetical protein
MTERTQVSLRSVLGSCNGSRRMLEMVLEKHPGLLIEKNLARQIRRGEIVDKGDIYRRVMSGFGRAKCHCSAHYPKDEGKLKNS